MPEIITKHPAIVLQVLKSEGAQCGTGAKPKILKSCPADKFCTLAGGELCVFGSDELGQMTQLKPGDLCKSSASSTSSGAVMPVDSSSAGADDHALAGAAPIALAMMAAVGGVRLRRRLALLR